MPVGRFHHRLNVRFVVGDARQQRGHHHPGGNSVLHQVLHGLQPGLGLRGPRLHHPPHLLVHGSHAEIDVDIGHLAKFRQDVGVAAHQDPLGGDGDRVLEVPKDVEDAARDLVFGLGRFVGI